MHDIVQCSNNRCLCYLKEQKTKNKKTMSRVFSCLKGNERNDFPGEKKTKQTCCLYFVFLNFFYFFFPNIHFEFPFSGLEMKRSLLKTILAYSSDTTRVTEIQCNMF